MTREQNTSRKGSLAGSTSSNGHNPEGDTDGQTAWSPGVMLGDELDAHRDEVIYEVVDGDAWNALRKFSRRFDVGLNSETTFAELDTVPAHAWDACGLQPPTLRAVAEFIAEYAYPLPDPQEAGERLKAARAERFRERDRINRALKPKGVTGAADYPLSEVERVCGADVADAARQMIEQHNSDTWNMGTAARRHQRDEHTYLITAAELVAKLDVLADQVALMQTATPKQRSAALADLADARALHRAGGVAEADADAVSRRWLTLDDLDDLPGTSWLVDKLLAAGSLTHLIGMPGSLKSFIALDMSLSLATGTPFAGSGMFSVAAQGHVVYVVAEGVRGINSRVMAWCERRGVERAKITPNFTLLKGGAQLGSRRDMADVTEKIIETGACLVVFDTQARCTVGLEENNATDQGRAIARIDALMLRTGSAALVLHHTTKADPRNARGSVAWKGAVDTELIAVCDGKSALEVRLEVGKMKDDEDGHTYPLKAVEVMPPAGKKSSLVIAPGADPWTVDPDLPMDQWTGNGKSVAPQMYALAQENCIPSEGLTQHRLSEIANEVVGDEVDHKGRTRKKRKVASKATAIGAVKLLVEHEWLVVSKRDHLGHVFYEPRDYPPPNPADVSGLTGENSQVGDHGAAPPNTT